MNRFLILSLCFLCLMGPSSVRAQNLSTDDFEQQLKKTPGAQLLDVRTPGEFGGGHLPGATNLDFRNPAFGQNVASLDKTKPVYVYCLSGGRSAEAAKLMREQGFASVYELQGGYLKWTTKLKPIEGAKASPTAKAITPAELKALSASNQLVLVDFYAPWCAPCQKMMPIMEQLQTQYAGKVLVVKADADASKALMQAYQVDEIPTLLLLKQGKLTERLIGLQSAAYLTDLLDKNL
ncbi:thioredoxin [Spirosoma lacussanchae]|uniref:thioredoxin domain-containing protein n=1 Tax=Spirosoma lacussanchae TaxID=1884249 RepID=UPI00110811FC|nr:thioredoxin domain-containing protein [Spirosoma lacussanchae]